MGRASTPSCVSTLAVSCSVQWEDPSLPSRVQDPQLPPPDAEVSLSSSAGLLYVTLPTTVHPQDG